LARVDRFDDCVENRTARETMKNALDLVLLFSLCCLAGCFAALLFMGIREIVFCFITVNDQCCTSSHVLILYAAFPLAALFAGLRMLEKRR
jgi:hypothetical protein